MVSVSCEVLCSPADAIQSWFTTITGLEGPCLGAFTVCLCGPDGPREGDLAIECGEAHSRPVKGVEDQPGPVWFPSIPAGRDRRQWF